MRKILFLLAATMFVQPPAGASAAAQAQAESAPEVLTPTDRKAVLAALKKTITAHYLDPKRKGPIVAALTAHEREGRYAIDDPKELATRLADDLVAAGEDKHLRVYHNPAFAARLAKAKEGDRAPTEAGLLASARRNNHGVRQMRVYPGNIRYLHLDSFERWTGEESIQAYDHAMKFLSGADAIIVDLRGNGGGSAEAYSYFESHFVEAGTPLFTSTINGVKGEEVRAVEKLPAGRLVGKPLWVLSDVKAASATEAFLYDVRHRKLGEIVGAKSAGAANHNRYFPLPNGFVASVSVGGPAMASTGGNWEREGVLPHVETAPELALETALLRATEKVAADAPPELKALAAKEVEKRRVELEKLQASHAAAPKSANLTK